LFFFFFEKIDFSRMYIVFVAAIAMLLASASVNGERCGESDLNGYGGAVYGMNGAGWRDAGFSSSHLYALVASGERAFVGGDFKRTLKLPNASDSSNGVEIKVKNLVEYETLSGRFVPLSFAEQAKDDDVNTALPATIRVMGIYDDVLYVAGDSFVPKSHSHGKKSVKQAMIGAWDLTSAQGTGRWRWLNANGTDAGYDADHVDVMTYGSRHKMMGGNLDSVRALTFDEVSGDLYVSYGYSVLRCATHRDAIDRFVWRVAGMPNDTALVDALAVAPSSGGDAHVFAGSVSDHHFDGGDPSDWSAALIHLPAGARGDQWRTVALPVSLHSISQVTVVPGGGGAQADELLVAGWGHGRGYVLSAPLDRAVSANASADDWRTIFEGSTEWRNFGNYTAPIVAVRGSDLVVAGLFELDGLGPSSNETAGGTVVVEQWRTVSVANRAQRTTPFGGSQGFDHFRVNGLAFFQLGAQYSALSIATDFEHKARQIETGDYIMLVCIIAYGIVAIGGVVFLGVHCNREGCCFRCCKCGRPPAETPQFDIFDEDYDPVATDEYD
jgi:hypothetical protein